MNQYCYVIINNAGHSWLAPGPGDSTEVKESNVPVLSQLLQDGWVPIRETPMGGGTSHLAHSLILLERSHPEASPRRQMKTRKVKGK
jgi:hypothetical protein